jgi:hypothetical protein
MDSPTTKVGYTSATNMMAGPRSLYGHVVAMGEKYFEEAVRSGMN